MRDYDADAAKYPWRPPVRFSRLFAICGLACLTLSSLVNVVLVLPVWRERENERERERERERENERKRERERD